jgi:biopolymer transport protein TolR
VFLQSSKEPLSYDELVAKLKAISQQRGGGFEERIFVRGDRKLDYGSVMKVMALLTAAGFRKVGLVTEVEQGH